MNSNYRTPGRLILALATLTISTVVLAAPPPARPLSVAELQTKAQAGDPAAQLELALRLENGSAGLAPNPAEAMRLLRAAAMKNDPTAQAELGRRLLADESSAAQQEGLALLEKAAAAKNDRAIVALASAYFDGRGGAAKDPAKGFALLKEAAATGSPVALHGLGEAYLKGNGVPADPAAAVEQFRKAADKDYPPAMVALARLLDGRRDASNRAGGIPADPPAAMKLALRAAQLGDVEAMRLAAEMYKKNDPANGKDKAVVWYRKLAEMRDPQGHADLAAASPDAYRKLARPLTVRGGKPVEAAVGTAAYFDGKVLIPTVDNASAAGWTVEGVAPGSSAPVRIPVDPSLYKGNAKPGMAVRVHGDVTRDLGLRAFVVDLPQPKFEWKYTLDAGSGPAAGTTQKYTVNGAVKNTGKQPLKNIKVNIRLYQVSSPNEASGDLTIGAINPGEVKPFTASVSWYNYQYIGATSVPKVEFKVVSYDW